jgi:hypothetical protein
MDFSEGSIREIETGNQIDVGAWPIGSVFAYMSNTDPATTLGFGVWAAVGTLTIGVSTVYFFYRTD